MGQELKTVTFDIEGEFITRLAREWMFLEGKDFEKVMELLSSCMCGTDMSEKELHRHAEDILLGRAEFSGTTSAGTFCMTTYDADEQPDIVGRFNIFYRYSEELRKRKQAEVERNKYIDWYNAAMERVPEYLQNEVRQETGQPVESRYGSSILDGFMDRMLDKTEYSTEDYGWLVPDGTFHEVDWGEHQEWTQNYIDEHFPEVNDDSKVDLQSKCGVGLIGAGDWLVERGWVLLHSPSQGIAFPTKNPLKRYTKAQQEFLYDYYMERGKKKRQMLCMRNNEVKIYGRYIWKMV